MSESKKIMILGASILQLPAIYKAKEMGLQVIAVDMNKNAIGFREADICLEISTIDVQKIVVAAKEYKIDGIMTLASDMPMRTVAAVANELDLVGITEETALKATNKALMRECLKEHDVPIPKFFRVNSKEEYLNALEKFISKCIVKPVDNSGSRGVYLLTDLTNIEEVNNAFDYSKRFSKNGDILVEEFMEGPEVSVETLSIDGKCQIIQITDKLTAGAPYFVEMGHSQPSMLPNSIVTIISKIAVAAVMAIGIHNGPSHTEIKISADGPKVVEVGARLGGDNITTHLVPLSTGVNMVESCINIALGERPDIVKKLDKGSAIRYFSIGTGLIKNILGIDEARQIEGIKEIFIVHGIGENSQEIRSSEDRVGYVIAQGDDAEKATKICESALEKIIFKLGV